MKWNVVIAGSLILLGLAGVGGGLVLWKNLKSAGGAHGAFEPAESVQVVESRTASWRPTATLVGTVFATRSVTVSNEIAGTIKEIGFVSGSVLQKGDLLLSLDTSTEESDLESAQAAIRVAEAAQKMGTSDLRLAEANWKRINDARENLAVTEMEVDKYRTEVETARAKSDRMTAELDQAKARAGQVRALIEKKRIAAPFKGRVGIRHVHPGQYLKEGTEVVSLQGIDDQAYLDFALPQEQAWRVSPGAVFMATSPLLGPEPFRIEVTALDSQVNMATRNVRVRAVVDNKSQVFRAGMSVEISVPIDEAREFVVVPSLAVRHATFGDHVFIIGASSKPEDPPGTLRATQRFIKLGPTIGGDVIVAEGLKVGERIASTGSFKLRDSGKVNVVQPPSTAVATPPAPAAIPTPGN